MSNCPNCERLTAELAVLRESLGLRNADDLLKLYAERDRLAAELVEWKHRDTVSNRIAEQAQEENDRLRAALEGIVALNPDIHSSEGFNEWGEADCFNQAQMIAREALRSA